MGAAREIPQLHGGTMEFGRTPEEIEESRRALLVMLFASAGSMILVVFGFLSLSEGRHGLALVLLLNAVLCLSLFLYNRLTRAHAREVSYFFAAQAFVLALYLILGGGVDGSGVFFAFPVTVIMVMAGFTSVRLAVFFCALLVGTAAVGLYGPFPAVYDYESVQKSRLLVGLSALCLMAILAEWMRVRSYMAITSTHDQLSVDARHDPLTGLLNRRGLEEAIGSMGEDAFPAALALLDLDHFKQVNDRYGHDVGDQVIRAVADHLRRHLKGRDLVCRWGGEEFLIVLTDTQCATAREVVEAIRENLSRTPQKLGGREHHLSFSGGLTRFNDPSHLDRALHEADQQLYRAKQQGRNRVLWRTEPG